MAFVALILVIWVALGVLVVGLLNLAKWIVRSSKRSDRAAAGNDRTPWPAPRPAPKLEPTATAALRQALSGAGRVDLGPSAPR